MITSPLCNFASRTNPFTVQNALTGWPTLKCAIDPGSGYGCTSSLRPGSAAPAANSSLRSIKNSKHRSNAEANASMEGTRAGDDDEEEGSGMCNWKASA
ncbi:hypothetical protein BCR44DRAFT_1431012 [Catenaria anguillulae PL171]|uniref:Uncharacterized protein n=1 Tax=Catenaria anguillulae PL171 TaxID=765915 RepID=A0A1Y2HRZ5_9FUNG|nr:hypothetical protein BCR44DRAFT_1431012 [Catenaria anguillulae PL171]